MVDFKHLMEKQDLQNVINALCERSNRCTICYNDTDGKNCAKCDEYYSECTCTPLTTDQIINGVEL